MLYRGGVRVLRLIVNGMCFGKYRHYRVPKTTVTATRNILEHRFFKL